MVMYELMTNASYENVEVQYESIGNYFNRTVGDHVVCRISGI